MNIKFISFVVGVIITTSLEAKSDFNKEMCFESYPIIRYEFTNRNPIYVDVDKMKAHPWAYSTIQMIIVNRYKDSNGFINFQVMGHGRNVAGDAAAINGVGYKKDGNYHFELKGSLFQHTVFDETNKSYEGTYELNSIMEFKDNQLQEGLGVAFNDVTNTNIFLSVPDEIDNYHNDFNINRVNRIPCNQYLK